jgi:hypothetical protein
MIRLKANGTNKSWVVFHLRSFGFHFKRVCIIINYRKPKELNFIVMGATLVHEKTRVRSSPLSLNNIWWFFFSQAQLNSTTSKFWLNDATNVQIVHLHCWPIYGRCCLYSLRSSILFVYYSCFDGYVL